MIGRVSIVKISVLLILASRFNAIPIQITPGFFEELDNLVPKFIRTKARVNKMLKERKEVRKEKKKKNDLPQAWQGYSKYTEGFTQVWGIDQ